MGEIDFTDPFWVFLSLVLVMLWRAVDSRAEARLEELRKDLDAPPQATLALPVVLLSLGPTLAYVRRAIVLSAEATGFSCLIERDGVVFEYVFKHNGEYVRVPTTSATAQVWTPCEIKVRTELDTWRPLKGESDPFAVPQMENFL